MKQLPFDELGEIQSQAGVRIDGPEAAGGALEMNGDIGQDCVAFPDGPFHDGSFLTLPAAPAPLIFAQRCDALFGNFNPETEHTAIGEYEIAGVRLRVSPAIGSGPGCR